MMIDRILCLERVEVWKEGYIVLISGYCCTNQSKPRLGGVINININRHVLHF